MGLIPEKSTDERWKFAYELAISLLPSAVKLMGLPILEEPVIEILKAFGGESVEELFREKTPLEKTAVLIGNTLKELLENDAYNYLKTFFEEEKFDFSQVDLTKGTTPLADYFTERIIEKYSIPVGIQQDSMRSNMTIFSKGLLEQIKEKIDNNTELHTFWTIKDNNEKITYLYDAYKADEKPINHNADYINKWNERCCLHRNPTQPLVTLETIYVMPEVQVGEERLKVGDCVKDFLKNDTQHILLLLGHGGYGKTSFVARMAAKTNEYTDRPLHIFRLREFADTDANELYKRIAEMAKLENNAVLVFDGLDELCMVGGGNETEKSLDLLTQLMFFFDQSSSYKIIITSRPEYISAEKALERLKKLKISAKHFVSYCYAAFSERQRGDLVDSIEKADPALKGSLGCEQVRKFEDKKDDGFLFKDDANKGDAIYGSPFLLYLICAAHEKLTPECFENRWLLFRTVFHDINPQPDYKKMQENTTGRGAVAMEHLDKLYRITSRLAYEIYKSRYEKQYFQKEEVRKVIEEMYGDTSDLIDKLESCYALCAYFKQTENGAVEFAHNHVRDFFLCEYILQGLDDLYAKRPEMTAEECGKLVADWLSDYFRYADTKYETDGFLKLAAKQKKTACPNVEQYFKPDELKHVFNVFCKNGGLREYCAEEMPIGAQSAARNVIACSACFLQTLLPETDDLIRWFDVGQLNDGERVIIEPMEFCLNKADLSVADLIDADMRGANLRGAYLRGADLRGALLRYANLSSADLSDADLSDADLSDADLSDADLSDADLRDADLRDADLSDADLSSADLRDADLSSADLSDADLSDADLSDADLSGANLSGAILMDTNLSGADLSGADLRGADLRDADLIDADLSGAHYDNGTDFTNVTPSDFDPEKAGMIKVGI